MEYVYERFDYTHELVNFLNKAKIEKKSIISIYPNGNSIYLIYIVESEGK